MKTMVERVLKSSHMLGLARTRQVPIMALCASLWTMTGSAQDGEAFFASDVSPHVEPCFACMVELQTTVGRGWFSGTAPTASITTQWLTFMPIRMWIRR